MIKKTTKTILLTFMALLAFSAVSGSANAAKKGTISADKCKGGVVMVKVAKVLAPNSYIVNKNKVYKQFLSQSTTDRSSRYYYRNLPSNLSKARITIPSTGFTYTSTFSSALKRGKGKLCSSV